MLPQSRSRSKGQGSEAHGFRHNVRRPARPQQVAGEKNVEMQAARAQLIAQGRRLLQAARREAARQVALEYLRHIFLGFAVAGKVERKHIEATKSK